MFVFFVAGLLASFWISGIFGISAPVFWSVAVVIFFLGAFFLEHPRIYLSLVVFYYGFFNQGILFGFLPFYLPMGRIIDELWLSLPVLMIMMGATQFTNPKGATRFPLIFLSLAILSAWLNHVPAMNAFRVITAYMKFYIFWYFVRMLAPWSPRQKWIVFLMCIGFAFLQFPLDVYWQRGFRVAGNPDDSRGTLGHAHYVGYWSVYVMFLMVGWFLTCWRKIKFFPLAVAGGVFILIAYNFIFMTGTRHALFFAPVALSLMLLTTSSIRGGTKLMAILGIFFVGAVSWYYLTEVAKIAEIYRYWQVIKLSGKGSIWKAIWFDLPGILPFYPLGAGPGGFCSAVALFSLQPLAMKYIMPFTMYNVGVVDYGSASTILGNPITSFFTLLGEFGILNTIVYVCFWVYVVRHLLRRAKDPITSDFDRGQIIGLLSCLLFLTMSSVMIETLNFGVLNIPIWILVGIYWDAPAREAQPQAGGAGPLAAKGMGRFDRSSVAPRESPAFLR